VDHDATLKRDLESLLEPVTRGHRETPLRWTCKSVRQLVAEFQSMGRWPNFCISQMEYSLQCPSENVEGSSPPDRDAQFHHISDPDRQPGFLWIRRRKNWWATSKTRGANCGPKGDPEKMRVHDFVIPQLEREPGNVPRRT
jgi:hypothetical protein